MKKVIINIFIFYNIELCCSFCPYKNLHLNHKLLEISDLDSLEKENITIESSIREFNEITKKVIDLKNKIENEINEVNTLYEKTLNDLKNSYILKHEKLIKEENLFIEELQNKVTKVKEQLENFLSLSNNNIKFSEKIEKGIKKLEKEEKNIIKNLSYVSKINKTKKEMKKLFNELIYGLKFEYNEENNHIKYDEYFFNGLPVPKDIKFKNISCNSVDIFWKIDEINILNVDNRQINFIIEMKKGEKENFKKIYEGNKNTFCANNLNKNTNYEFRIRSMYKNNNDEFESLWSLPYKIRTKDLDFDSIILKESNREEEFNIKLKEWIKFKKLN